MVARSLVHSGRDAGCRRTVARLAGLLRNALRSLEAARPETAARELERACREG
jgi:hypothetical protein